MRTMPTAPLPAGVATAMMGASRSLSMLYVKIVRLCELILN